MILYGDSEEFAFCERFTLRFPIPLSRGVLYVPRGIRL